MWDVEQFEEGRQQTGQTQRGEIRKVRLLYDPPPSMPLTLTVFPTRRHRFGEDPTNHRFLRHTMWDLAHMHTK